MSVLKKLEPTVGKENRITEQAGKETQDINNMAKRAFRNRLKGDMDGREPIFGVVSALSYHEQMNMVLDIQNRFNRLPPRVRRQFKNDPYQALKFIEEPANLREAVKLGLVIDEEGVFDEKETDPRPNAVQTSITDPPPPEGSLDAFVAATAASDGSKPKGAKKA